MPTVPVARLAVVITGAVPVLAAVLTVIESDLVLLPAELDAVTVNENVPAADGVPLIMPVDALSDKPVGNDPLDTLHVMGVVPLAVKVAL